MAKIKIVRLTPRFHSHDPALRRGIDEHGEEWGEFAVDHLTMMHGRVGFDADCAGYVDQNCDMCGKHMTGRTFWMSHDGLCGCCECVDVPDRNNAADQETGGVSEPA